MGKCIAAEELREAIEISISLRNSLLKFVLAFGVQTSHTAICNVQSRLDVRLSRWLLMAHDRIGEDTLTLTHEFLSLMLGVRRPGVTEALQTLPRTRIDFVRAWANHGEGSQGNGGLGRRGLWYAEAEYRR